MPESSSNRVNKVDEIAWQQEARCRLLDVSIFYPASEEGEEADEAKTICGECPVISQCLNYALAHRPKEEGIWGGTTTKEREARRRHRGA